VTRAQFGFVVGFAAAVVWAVLGFLLMVGVLFAGAFGWALVGLIDGQWNTGEVRSWLSRTRKDREKTATRY
jgi:hypothetical protein